MPEIYATATNLRNGLTIQILGPFQTVQVAQDAVEKEEGEPLTWTREPSGNHRTECHPALWIINAPVRRESGRGGYPGGFCPKC